MSRKGVRFSAVIAALSLSAMLAACGGADKNTVADNPGGVARVAEASCQVCHSTTLDPISATPIFAGFLASPHNTEIAGCQGCHGGGALHNGVVGAFPFTDPVASDRCSTNECHAHAGKVPTKEATGTFVANCAPCHTPSGAGSIHDVQLLSRLPVKSCTVCHAIAAPQHGPNKVGDNFGVRAVVGEFAKWSHHITGVAPNDAHCAACHLEGKVGANGTIVLDAAYHMADNKTHLRNVDDDSDMQWDPNAPNHRTMDTFCMGCHDANGATSDMSVKIQAFINSNGIAASGQSASAGNPFGDTISNRYDKMLRGRVVDVDGQFATGNNSHHAVKGKKYSGSERGDGLSARSVNTASFSINSSASLPGVRETLKEAGVLKTFAAGELQTIVNPNPTNLATFNLNTRYQTLSPAAGNDATLGDDSTLHCADCHTVGQYAAKGSVAYNNAKSAYAAYTSYNRVAIGAHGSNNEYLLRNSKGTDELHVAANYNLTATVASGNFMKFNNPGGAFLVCYNCHAFQTYGSVYALGDGPGHIGEYAKGNRCNGENNTFAGYTTGTLVTFAGVSNFNKSRLYNGSLGNGSSGAGGGNIFAIQCSNCHNSGPDNKFGGIHGSRIQTYPDANGIQQPARRFLSGLGDWKHVPMGSVDTLANTFGVAPATGWEMEKARTGEGCYTLSSKTSNSVSVASSTNASGERMLGTWGACTDHGGTPPGGTSGNPAVTNSKSYAIGGDAFERKIIRPVAY
jgi:hypothetical protein